MKVIRAKTIQKRHLNKDKIFPFINSSEHDFLPFISINNDTNDKLHSLYGSGLSISLFLTDNYVKMAEQEWPYISLVLPCIDLNKR